MKFTQLAIARVLQSILDSGLFALIESYILFLNMRLFISLRLCACRASVLRVRLHEEDENVFSCFFALLFYLCTARRPLFL